MSNEFVGKTAIISGGAGGIGFALAEEFGQLGMKIVIADIDQKELAKAEQALIDANIQVLACLLCLKLSLLIQDFLVLIYDFHNFCSP